MQYESYGNENDTLYSFYEILEIGFMLCFSSLRRGECMFYNTVCHIGSVLYDLNTISCHEKWITNTKYVNVMFP